MAGPGWSPCASILVCESWSAPPGYEVCCVGGVFLEGGYPRRTSQGWVSLGEEPLAWTPPRPDHYGFWKQA